MEELSIFEKIILFAIFIINIIVLVKFFNLCKDIRILRIIVANKWDSAYPQTAEDVNKHIATGSISPTKSDVKEFQDKIKDYRKTNKEDASQWIESLIKEYNNIFNEDFHQYL